MPRARKPTAKQLARRILAEWAGQQQAHGFGVLVIPPGVRVRGGGIVNGDNYADADADNRQTPGGGAAGGDQDGERVEAG